MVQSTKRQKEETRMNAIKKEELFKKVIKLTDEIKSTEDKSKLKILRKERRNIMYNIAHNK